MSCEEIATYRIGELPYLHQVTSHQTLPSELIRTSCTHFRSDITGNLGMLKQQATEIREGR